MKRAIQVAAVAVLLSTAAFAQSFNFTDFSSVAGLSLRGSAAQTGNVVRITNFAVNQTGAAWFGSPMLVVAGFDTTFTFKITPPTVGTIAEGMAFVVQNTTAGALALGGSVWGIGYGPGANGAALANSLAVEIDTFQDGFLNDTSANELTVHTNGTGNNNENETFSIGRTTPAVNMHNGLVHTLRVRYVPGTLDIFLDNLVTPVLSVPWSAQTGGNFLSNGAAVGGLNLPMGTAFVGFTGTTGAGSLNELVEILSWNFSSTAPTDPCFDGVVEASLGTPVDVLFANGSEGGLFRHVVVPTFQPLTIALNAPPAAMGSAGFVLFGKLGAANGSSALPLGALGTLCYPVSLPVLAPDTFILADSLGLGAPSFLPSAGTPFAFTLPAGLPFAAIGTYQGVVADATSPVGFSVTNAVIIETKTAPPPTITNLTPASAPAGTTINVVGSGFLPGIVADINGQIVPLLSQTATGVSFAYPAMVPCGATFRLTNLDGQFATRPINPNPTFTSSPNAQGPAAGGASYIIIGSGFAAGTTVTIGGVPATVSTASAGVIVCTTPPGTPGAATVLITTPGGCSVMTTYTYL